MICKSFQHYIQLNEKITKATYQKLILIFFLDTVF